MRNTTIFGVTGLIFLAITRLGGAAEHVVNSPADTSDFAAGDGQCMTKEGVCTLRAAIEETNAIGVPTDTITFSPAILPATITLTSALPDVAGLTVIDGPGADQLVIEAAAVPNAAIDRRVFTIAPASILAIASVVTLSDMTIRNGHKKGLPAQGGGILVSPGATLTLSGVVLIDNIAESDSFQPTAANAFGGGLYNGGTATLVQCTVKSNKAIASATNLFTRPDGYGGGIYAGPLALTEVNQCLIQANTAQGGDCAGHDGIAYGGGLSAHEQATALIRNTTIAQNIAQAGPDQGDAFGGGLYLPNNFSTSRKRVEFCTIVGNAINGVDDGSGGGISCGGFDGSEAAPRVRGTIFQGNSGTSSAEEFDFIQPSGFILFDGAPGNYIGTGADGIENSFDWVFPVTEEDLRLNPLGDNGGPTETYSYSGIPDYHVSSSLIDKCPCTFIDGSPVTTDQRGVERPFNGGLCDIGAFELDHNRRALGDFDNDLHTDLNDFLFLIDQWQKVTGIGPPAIGLDDFLALLDHW